MALTHTRAALTGRRPYAATMLALKRGVVKLRKLNTIPVTNRVSKVYIFVKNCNTTSKRTRCCVLSTHLGIFLSTFKIG